MDLAARLRNVFLVTDQKMEGVLNEIAVIAALQSLGFILPDDVKAKCKPMNCEEFCKFGLEVAKGLPADGGLKDLFKSLSGKSGAVGTDELRSIMETMKMSNAADLDKLVGVLDPNGTGSFDHTALVNAFQA